jgi:predicted transcriptional regulator
MADITEITREVVLKTQIMYKANLSFTQLNNYTALLLEKNLITPTVFDGREGYVVTTQGLNFLQKYRELIRMLETNGSNKKAALSTQNIVKKT